MLENIDRASKSVRVIKYIWCSFHLLNLLVTVWSDEEIASKEATMRTTILKGKKIRKGFFLKVNSEKSQDLDITEVCLVYSLC